MSGTGPVRAWSGSEFDPENVRVLSLLPDDEDGDYCVRHDQQMQSVVPVIHHAGALYTTADDVTCHTCGVCLSELLRSTVDVPRVAPDTDDTGTADLLRAAISREFDRWDAGDAPGEWFQYVRDDIDPDGRHVWLAATRDDATELVADDTDGGVDQDGSAGMNSR
jgi:hypothetical protein